MQAINKEVSSTFQTLDKDYGRTLIAGPGYGKFDLKQYELLEALVS